ncbi:hypothetical protein EVAR_104023_1 [Eumeta japonica]|uniref:Uncharacterized protein n=1 Tax=Eumeta variegata TaxID=151549 RepID=A0A4C1Z7C1_EUMVA|nr:hypothetical protein EVAR_104023_1 [Eumeta japonica]
MVKKGKFGVVNTSNLPFFTLRTILQRSHLRLKDCRRERVGVWCSKSLLCPAIPSGRTDFALYTATVSTDVRPDYCKTVQESLESRCSLLPMDICNLGGVTNVLLVSWKGIGYLIKERESELIEGKWTDKKGSRSPELVLIGERDKRQRKP